MRRADSRACSLGQRSGNPRIFLGVPGIVQETGPRRGPTAPSFWTRNVEDSPMPDHDPDTGAAQVTAGPTRRPKMSPEDRRVVLTRITECGLELANRLDEPLHQLFQKYVGRVGPQPRLGNARGKGGDLA